MNIKFRPHMFRQENNLYLVDLFKTEGRSAELEVYDLQSEQWSSITLSGVHFSRNFSANILGGWLYFIGRNDVDDGPSKRYHLQKGHLEDIKAYPWSINAPLTVALQVPAKIQQKKMLTNFQFK